MRLTRLTALRTAIVLAVGFVVLRVVYRTLFGGAGGGGAVLLDLPRIRLGGPFEHITLLGPVTSDGIMNAAISAIPFAVLVLALGLVAAVVDLRALLTRGANRGPVRDGLPRARRRMVDLPGAAGLGAESPSGSRASW